MAPQGSKGESVSQGGQRPHELSKTPSVLTAR
jgi:hypothetical protein